MAKRRISTTRKVVPVWLLRPWRDRVAEAAEWCARNDVRPITLLRARVAAKCPERVSLTRAERAEISTWDILEDDW